MLPALLFACLALIVPSLLQAHGALIDHSRAEGIVIHAIYDTGQPMSGAQVTVYAPDVPAKPWLTGTCDEQGRFSFVPDPALSGRWTVQARLAGHGAMAHIPVDESEPLSAQAVTPGFTPGQRGLMAACFVWGCIGTALYFIPRRNS